MPVYLGVVGFVVSMVARPAEGSIAPQTVTGTCPDAPLADHQFLLGVAGQEFHQ